MSQRTKLIRSIRNNPKDVRFEDACKAAEMLGFFHKGGSGSHRAFARPGEPTQLNFQQQKDGKLVPYQAKQLIAMIDQYWEDTDG